MVFTTVNVTTHKDMPVITIHDSIQGDRFSNLGVQALATLKAHKTINIYDSENGELILPYHSVLAWNVTKAEGEYTKPEDDFCKSESTPTGDITLLDGTYEFTGDEALGLYRASLDKCYNPANVTVTVDGTIATLPKFAENMYGKFEGNPPTLVFTTYPAGVNFVRSTNALVIAVPTAGSHTVKVTVPNGSEIECS